MSKFYYRLQATADENVGEITASDEDDALKQLKDIYAPANPLTGEAHAGIEIKIIDASQYKSDKKRIAQERKAAAKAVPDSEN